MKGHGMLGVYIIILIVSTYLIDVLIERLTKSKKEILISKKYIYEIALDWEPTTYYMIIGNDGIEYRVHYPRWLSKYSEKELYDSLEIGRRYVFDMYGLKIPFISSQKIYKKLGKV
jgi:hypothetical protein